MGFRLRCEVSITQWSGRIHRVFVSDKLKIRNESGLALDLDLVIAPPFYIVVDGKAVAMLYLKLNNLSNRTVIVEFHPPPHQKRCVRYNQTFYVNYKDHSKVVSCDRITSC